MVTKKQLLRRIQQQDKEINSLRGLISKIRQENNLSYRVPSTSIQDFGTIAGYYKPIHVKEVVKLILNKMGLEIKEGKVMEENVKVTLVKEK